MDLTAEYLQKIVGVFPIGCQKIRIVCPYCSPQQTKERHAKKKCAAFMRSNKCDHDWVFHCCRCGKTHNFPHYLKEQHPKLFLEYHLKRDQEGSTGKGFNLERFQGSQDYQPKFGG